MSGSLKGRRLIVAVSGGIAAYKAAELVRLFRRADADVWVMMTAAATRFVAPLTFQALSGHPVATDLFDLQVEATIGHIELADRAELLVVAPASADLLARLALGMADDVVTTVALACRAPLLVAPAMNVNMWDHPATHANLKVLRDRGVRVVGPETGDLACGWVGPGRMVEPSEIVASAEALFGVRDLTGWRVLVTAGPTHEPLDPVRFLGNRSSGKMGFALAKRAAERGAEVTLVSGPVALATPVGVERVDVETAAEMRREVLARADTQHLIVKAAAVADYRPKSRAREKLKKSTLGTHLTIELEANPDILAELTARRRADRRTVIVGFAAETSDLEDIAQRKWRHKGCDLLVANDVTENGSGFGTDTNRVLFVDEKGIDSLPLLSKEELAGRILDRALEIMKRREPG
jgi:phosphopantothenoylcysteine decarboxylase/phosphopantothenate--cysteine ligase